MQNVVTVPTSATGTSSSVGTPHVGHDPRGRVQHLHGDEDPQPAGS